ncbi:hypothetical protein [Nocardiopsis sp. JB363]|uniref:hypothetical protein n=1 Tax=Nocardiopsis sp. JB363 TaxID=1434837 RepID=UPI00097A5C18|nr:hypothetical protein [Nocardiopsis sp. JB363]SIO85909.1 hypothetical protein BQ8420_09330 [Nocardiopsis sp. JB363]
MSAMTERLDELADVARLRREVDVIERDRITAAREAGASWDRIAQTLGIRTRQGAQQRHTALIKATTPEDE